MVTTVSATAQVLRRASAALMLLGLLQGCGGGGGAVPLPIPVPGPAPAPAPVSGSVSATFTPDTVTASSVSGQGFAPRASAVAQLNYTGNRNIYVGVREETGLLQDYSVVVYDRRLELSMAFNPQRPVGTHTSDLQVLVCFDTECRETVPGSPLRLPVRLEVTPNIGMQPTLALARSGRDPAPGATVPISVPAGAGVLRLGSTSTGTDAINVELVNNNALRVSTTQARAGTYTTRVAVASNTSQLYSATMDVTYTVAPPPGGEQPLAILRTPGSTAIEQGQTSVQRFSVQRPTWTDAFSGPTISASSGTVSLRALGNDTYEFSFDAGGLAPDSFSRVEVSVAAGNAGGATAPWFYSVGAAFNVEGAMVQLNADSTAAALRGSMSVQVTSGAPARWTARSLSPLLTLPRTSGITGVDALEFAVDQPAALAAVGGLSLPFEVRIDRPGTLPVTSQVGVSNSIATVDAVLAGALVGTSGTAYVEGNFGYGTGGISRLQVQGATVRRATLVADTRFVGDMLVLKLELDGAVVGRDVVISMPATLKTTQVRLPVRDVPRVAAGYAALPLAAWRSPRFALGSDTLHFAAPDRLARWAWANNAWTLTTAAMPGISDGALFPSEAFIIAAGGARAWRVDPTTLAASSSIDLGSDVWFSSPAKGLEAAPAQPNAALAFAADGASTALLSPLFATAGGSTLRGISGSLQPLTGSYGNGNDPGSGYWGPTTGTHRPGGIVRSAAGWVVIGQLLNAQRVYSVTNRVPRIGELLPEGTDVRAVSDDGLTMVRSDGVIHRRGSPLAGSLDLQLPPGFVAGGYGLSGDGRHAVVYGYRMADEAGAQRARDAAVWVLDIGAIDRNGTAAALLVQRILLADAVGCTQALQPGETCRHAANVAVVEGGGSAFVLGPRGVAALPLPVAVASPPPVSLGIPARPLRMLPASGAGSR